jgi:phenylacetate-coenzyme A ligase PaaK-like adenylate-forming protein
MNALGKIFELEPFELTNNQKKSIFTSKIKELNQYHFNNCAEYKKIISYLHKGRKINFKDLPPLPVGLFKNNNLISISKKKIIRQLVSSGTSSNNRSKINIDLENSKNQIKTLQKISSEYLGKDRMHMAILGQEKKNNNFQLNASNAAVSGFSLFGKNHTYLIDENGNFNKDRLIEFANKFKNEKKLLFGFTFNIYKYFIKNIPGQNINLSNSILLHGGGWKKLERYKISNEKFSKILKSKYEINKIINYYGLVEQTGSIYFECEEGFFHTSNYSDILIKNNYLDECDHGTKGLVQLISLLPKSYPGHNIITEDIGAIYGVDNCKCKRNGKIFKIFGRVKDSETRGCSDAQQS